MRICMGLGRRPVCLGAVWLRRLRSWRGISTAIEMAGELIECLVSLALPRFEYTKAAGATSWDLDGH